MRLNNNSESRDNNLLRGEENFVAKHTWLGRNNSYLDNAERKTFRLYITNNQAAYSNYFRP